MSAGDRRLDVSSPIGRLVQRMATSDWFRRIGPVVVPPLDRLLSRLTGGRVLLGRALLPMLMLHHVGRRSGRDRTTPLATLPVEDGFLVVGSNFGREQHPAWTFNLMANPEAEVEYGGERVPVVAHHLDDDERADAWPGLVRLWPAFDRYEEKAGGRDLRVFRLERT